MKQIKRIIDSSTVTMLFIIIFICSYVKTLLTFSTVKYFLIWEGCFKWPFSFPADIILNIAVMVKSIYHVIFFLQVHAKKTKLYKMSLSIAILINKCRISQFIIWHIENKCWCDITYKNNLMLPFMFLLISKTTVLL